MRRHAGELALMDAANCGNPVREMGGDARVAAAQLDFVLEHIDSAKRDGAVQAGYIWINDVGRHFPGAPFGGVKQSGFGREECLEEMLRFTQEQNVHIKLRRNPP